MCVKLQCPYLLSSLQLRICQLSCSHVFDVVFHFGLLLTQTSLGLPLDACMGYKEDCTFFPVNAFPFFFSRSNVFYFIVRKRILSTDSCTVIVVYLQGVGV